MKQKYHFKTNEDLRKFCFKILSEEIGLSVEDLMDEIIKRERERLMHEISIIFNRYRTKEEYCHYHRIPDEVYQKLVNKNRWRTKKQMREETLEELEEE